VTSGTSSTDDARTGPRLAVRRPPHPEAWAQVLDALGPVLDEHGFGPVHDNDSNTGGWAYLSAEDGNSAVLSLRSKACTELGVSGGSVLRGAETECPRRDEE
jgi:hypothetical protein